VFGADNQAWECLAGSAVRAKTWRSTCINQPRVRAAIVKCLAERIEQTGGIGRKDVEEVVATFDRQDGCWSYDHVPWDEMPRVSGRQKDCGEEKKSGKFGQPAKIGFRQTGDGP